MIVRSIHTLNLVLLVTLEACSFSSRTQERNPDHCTWHDGDTYCERLFPEKPLCTNGVGECGRPNERYGCFAETDEVGGDPACRHQCGELSPDTCDGVGMDDSSTGEPGSESSGDEVNASTTEGEATEGEELSEGESTTGLLECTGHDDCGEVGQPLCVRGACVPCSDADAEASCSNLGDAARGVCEAGACVECTLAQPEACSVTQQVCNEGTHVCENCTAHEQCGTGDEAACHIEAGTCFSNDPDDVLHVGPGEEFTSICDLDNNPALIEIAEGEQAVVVLHGTTNFDEACTLEGNRVVAFKMASDADLDWIQSNTDQAPTLTLSDGAVVYLDGIRLTLNGQADAAVVAANGATTYIEDCELSGNQDLAISADNARVVIDDSRIVGNGGGITATANSNVTLTNVFVSGPNNISAVTLEGASTLTALYSTLGNTNLDDDAALRCDETSSANLRNSIVVSQVGSPAISCVSSTTPTSGIFDGSTTPSFDADWFVDYENGDYHLENDGLTVFEGLASWQQGDPPTDIDGDARPIAPGPDFVGADLPSNP